MIYVHLPRRADNNIVTTPLAHGKAKTRCPGSRVVGRWRRIADPVHRSSPWELALFRTLASPQNWLCLYGGLPTDYGLPTTDYGLLALFCRGLRQVRFVITLFPCGTCPLVGGWPNWVCFAQSALVPQAPAHPAPPGLALFDTATSCLSLPRRARSTRRKEIRAARGSPRLAWLLGVQMPRFLPPWSP